MDIRSVSESGVFESTTGFSKVYSVEHISDLGAMYECCRKTGADFELTGQDAFTQAHVLARINGCDLTEAMERFAAMEQEMGKAALTAEERLERLCGFFSCFLGRKYTADNYFLDTQDWKPAARLEGAVFLDKSVQTEAGVFLAAVIREFPEHIGKGIIFELTEKEYVEGYEIFLNQVSNQSVAEMLHGEYLGIEGLLPRMQRKAPELYDILSGKQGGENHFVRTGGFFLLKAENEDALERDAAEFFREAGKQGLRLERFPIAEQKNPREVKKLFGMFGTSGSRQNSYSTLVREKEAVNLVTESQKTEEEKKRVLLEELRTLFYQGGEEE